MADPKQIADALAQDQLLAQFNRGEGQAQPWYMKPMDMEGRATFLPFKDSLPGSVMNQRELALPGLLAGAVNAFTAPGRVSTQGFDAPEEAQNLAMNTFGGGITTGKMMQKPTGVGGTDLLSSGIKPIDYAKILEIEKTRLYHGSHDENLNTVEDKGVFRGIFGSPTEQSALSHGNNLYYSDIPKNKILTHYNLNYEIPYEQVSQALTKAYPSLKKDKDLYDKVWDIVVADKGQNINHLSEDDLLKIFHTNDFAEAGLEAQKIRGQVSKNLGYKAVELGDEHGTSYLLHPGVKLEKK
jgi:hypothetical protein